MIRSYLLVAWRSLRKHFVYSIINTAGLGLGLSTCLLLALWIRHELSYDDFHENGNRLYRVSLEYSFGGQVAKTSVSPSALLPAMTRNFAEVENGVRFYNSASFRPFVVRKDDRLFEESRFHFADSTFFQVFSFDLVQGDAERALSLPQSLVLTESMARKYFGAEDPLGKVVSVNDEKDYTITGIMRDVPANSMLQFDFVASFSTLSVSREPIWWSANYQTYILLSALADPQVLGQKVVELVRKELGSELSGPGDYVRFHLNPMKDIYLKSDVEEPERVGSIQYVYVFSGIALLVLLIACINYVNLATARAVDRAKEVGVRKVIGAARRQLFAQFIGESILITFLSFILAVLLAAIALPLFNELTGKSFGATTLVDPHFIASALLLLVCIACVSGIYPALVITRYRPVNILKGNFRSSNRGVWLRQSLVILQFSVSITLVIGTMVILKQLEFMQSKNLGYKKENVIQLPFDDKTKRIFSELRSELLRGGTIVTVGRASEAPTHIKGGYSINVPATREQGMMVTAMPVDEGFIPAMGMELSSGMNFSENDFRRLRHDTTYSFILNQAALKELYLEEEKALGMRVRLNGRNGTIVGIIKDFHFASMHERIGPLVLFTEESQLNFIFVRIQAGRTDKSLTALKKTWSELVPHRPFEYRFLNEGYAALYQGEQRMGSLCSVFSLLANVIACLGLLGLVSFATSQRTKEIGIRKVLGATQCNIVLLVTGHFTWLVAAAVATGIPLSWYVMEHFWLSHFVYRTPIGIWPFIVAPAGCLILAFLTAGYQAVKAALINPANTLRSE